MPRSIIPEPTVFATAVPNPNAAMKLKNAAHATAWPGDSTRVDTTVAIEFAASWKPLMKSKHSASRISAITVSSVGSMQPVRYACLTRMPSIAVATSLQRSVAPSSMSRISFHLKIAIASLSRSNRSPTAVA